MEEQPPSITTAQANPGGQGSASSRCPERVVDLTRTSRCGSTGGTWIDNGAEVNEELLAVIPKKARRMQTIFQKGYVDLNFEGQIGFVCVAKDHQSGEPKSCVPVTAIHNIAQIKDSPEAEYVRSTAMFHTFNTGIPFPEAGGAEPDTLTPYELVSSTESSVPWKYGIDIAWSSLRITATPSSPASLHIVASCFERVRDSFVCWEGQRVGIAIYSETGATPSTAGVPYVAQAELDRIYGPPRHTHIYTGKITFVGSHHIEYDINAFEGCAGAIVFLLGLETQPKDSGVTINDVGKAIAVHAGAHPRKIKNIGFKIAAKPPPV